MNETLPYKIYPKLHNPTKTQDCVVVVLHCSYFCSNCNYNKWRVAEHKQSVQRPVVINWTPGQPQCDNLWECSELLSEPRGEVCLQAYDWLGVSQLSYCIVIVSSVNTRQRSRKLVWMSHFPHLNNKNGKQLKQDNLG